MKTDTTHDTLFGVVTSLKFRRLDDEHSCYVFTEPEVPGYVAHITDATYSYPLPNDPEGDPIEINIYYNGDIVPCHQARLDGRAGLEGWHIGRVGYRPERATILELLELVVSAMLFDQKET